MQTIHWVVNRMEPGEDRWLPLMAAKHVEEVRAFHRSFAEYKETPLHSLSNMAAALGLGGLYIKDESERFGLNAFKVLGGSYAIARYFAKDKHLQDIGDLKAFLQNTASAPVTFYTATDGNHGRGVAWAARTMGHRAVVRMPQGTSQSRLENIRREGAEVTIEPLNYDDCVRLAAKQAASSLSNVLVQDTAWQGYEEIPSWIMQGYGTMADEAVEQMNQQGVQAPTHVFVQAGVGSLAGAIAGYFVQRFPEAPPKIVVMEASAADCHYRSALAGDGQIRTVDGDLATMMAGLACGEPNPISWSILRNHAAAFVSCPDWVSALGMRMLAAPLKGDRPIVSGESGAVGMGLVAAVMQREAYAELRAALSLNASSRVLLFSTEGDTDPVHYKNVVWGGEVPVPIGEKES